MYPQILFWKWDENHLLDDDIIKKIKDIDERSCFDTIFVGASWTQNGLFEKQLIDSVSNACDYIHSLNKKMIFEIDVRCQSDRKRFVEIYKDSLLAFALINEIVLDSAGRGTVVIEKTNNQDQFGVYKALWVDVLKIYLFNAQDGTYNKKTLVDITEKVVRIEDTIYIDFGSNYADKRIFCIANIWYDMPDPASDDTLRFLDSIFDLYKKIPLDGVAIDEWGYIPHPNFDFSVAWKNPWYSHTMAAEINYKFNVDIADFYFHMYYKSDDGIDSRVKYTNYYNEMIRKSTTKLENYLYKKAKELFGISCFVGVHPTWYAIDEVNNYPEIYKNGFNWWEIPRDFGFTDEICLYPIRSALTHKSYGNVWYNMWYGESTLDLTTFAKEIWTNARYGGRVISLGYEVRKENVTTEFTKSGNLEYLSDMEEKIGLLNKFQKASINCSVLIVFGIYATCSWLQNVNTNGRWNCYNSKIIDAFTLARDLWNGGYNCDLVPSYEIDNGSIQINKDGKAVYGTQEYESVIFIDLEYSKNQTLEFIKTIKTNFVLIGNVSTDFDGKTIEGIKDLSQLYFQTRPEINDIIFYLKNEKVPTNRVPYGSVLQDGSIIIANSGVENAIGNDLELAFCYKNIKIKFKSKDIFAIKFDASGKIEKLLSNELEYLFINDNLVKGDVDL